jgi:hypothetical protein
LQRFRLGLRLRRLGRQSPWSKLRQRKSGSQKRQVDEYR